MRATATLLALVLAALATPVCRAEIVFSNIKEGDIFGPGIGIGYIPFSQTYNYAGVGFTPKTTVYFDSFEMPVSLEMPGPNSLNIYLMSDDQGLPHGILEQFHRRDLLSMDPQNMVRIKSVTRPALVAGHRYWIVAAAGVKTFATWKQNVHNGMGPNVSGPSLKTLVRDPDTNVIEAIRISGTPVP